jgi:hypothetical protein
MANATRSQLEQAYNLIQQDQLNQAIAILKPITRQEPNNSDAWWLMANAVSEPEDAYEALENVLRLNPANDQARELMQQLEQEFPQLRGRPAPVASSSDFGDFNGTFDDLFGSSTTSPTSNSSSTSTSFSSDDLDELLGDSSSSTGFSSSTSVDDLFTSGALDDSQSLNTFLENNADSSFGSTSGSFSSFDDPFASSDPTFMQDEMLTEAPSKGKPARGRAQPKPRKEEKPKPAKPTKIVMEAPPMDPLELERRANRKPNPMVIGVLLLLVASLVGGGLFVANNIGVITGNVPAATNVPADVNIVIPANDVPAAVEAIKIQLTAKGFAAVSASVVVSPIGDTFQVQFCDKPSVDVLKRITLAQDLVAQAAAAIREKVKGAGIDIISCSNASVRLYRAVSQIDDIVSYVDGGLKDKKAFKASWQKS